MLKEKLVRIHFISCLIEWCLLQAKKNEIDYCEPTLLGIQQSKIPGAGQGIFANIHIAQNTRFGPYVGEKVEALADAFISGYSWAVSTLLYDL